MTVFIRVLVLMLIGSLVVACTSTEIVRSWSSPYYKGPIKKVYLIGVAANEVNRRIFEDSFINQFATQSVNAVSSYKDLPKNEEFDKDNIKRRMAENGCDSVLLTKLVGQQTKTVTNTGRSAAFSMGPYYGGRDNYGRPAYYSSWDNYYNSRIEIVYAPAATTQFEILTVESVLYDLKTEGLIWSARIETIVDVNLDKMMQEYVQEVIKDLKGKGLI